MYSWLQFWTLCMQATVTQDRLEKWELTEENQNREICVGLVLLMERHQMTENYHHLLLQQLTSEDHLILWFQHFFIDLISLSGIVHTCSCSSPIDYNIHRRLLTTWAAGRNHFSNCAITAWTLNWIYYWRYMSWQISTVYSPWNLITFPWRTYNGKFNSLKEI